MWTWARSITRGWMSCAGRLPHRRTGQKRVLAIARPLIYRLRVSSFRGAPPGSDEGHGIVWLCAVRRREEGSDDDAFAWFADLHTRGGQLLPSEDDRLRDLAEAAIRLHRGSDRRVAAARGRRLVATRYRVDGRPRGPHPVSRTSPGRRWRERDLVCAQQASEGTAGTSAIECATSCLRSWRTTFLTRSLRCGATGRRAGLSGGKWSGWVCASGWGLARHALDVLHRDI